MTGEQAERIASTQALFREVNERIAEVAQRLHSDSTAFVCECADPRCTELVATTLARYESVRRDDTAFLMASGHEDERVEAVVESDGRVAVVSHRHPLIEPLVRALDPRTPDRRLAAAGALAAQSNSSSSASVGA